MGEEKKVLAKAELSLHLQETVGMPDYQANWVLDSLFDFIASHVKEGNEVLLKGLGRFVYVDREGTRKSNLSGDLIVPHKQVKFRINQHLAKYVRINTRVE